MMTNINAISTVLPSDGDAVAPKAVWSTPKLTSVPISMSENAVGGAADSADTLS